MSRFQIIWMSWLSWHVGLKHTLSSVMSQVTNHMATELHSCVGSQERGPQLFTVKSKMIAL